MMNAQIPGHEQHDWSELLENKNEVFTCQVCKEIGNEDGLHVHRLCANPPNFVDHPFYPHQRFHFCRERRQFQQCNAWYYETCESNKLRFHVACVKKVLAQIYSNDMKAGGLSMQAAPNKTPAVKKKKKKEEEEEDSLWETIWKTALTMILTALIGQIMPIGAAAIADGITSMIAKIIKFLKRG